tara:strand:- start:1400 stop:1618 length:219 start_codon:yes stop_codon:yes gene_type:complete
MSEPTKETLKKGRICSFTGIEHPPNTKFVGEDTFRQMFGWEYPKVNPSRAFKHMETYKHPKNQGNNGKNSRF